MEYSRSQDRKGEQAGGDVPGSPFCRVAVPRPVRQTFVYRVPSELRGDVRPGSRVLVPFGRRKLVGVVDGLQRETELDRVRGVLDVLDARPVLPEEVLSLCRWTSGYYVAPPGLVLRAALPPGLLSESSYRVRLTEQGRAAADSAPETDGSGKGSGRRQAVIRRLHRSRRGLQVTTLRDELEIPSVWPVVRALEASGLVSVEEEAPEAGPSRETRQVIRLTRELPTLSQRQEVFGRAHRQREAFEALESMAGEATVAHLERQLGISRSVVRGLVDRGVARIEERDKRREPYSDLPEEPAPVLEPTPAQDQAVAALLERLDRPDPGVALIRGVTGSGKTLVYLELLEEVVGSRNEGAVVLVPEIALTPQTVRRFRARFGDRVAVLHSRLSPGERYDEWEALRSGEKRVAVGPRSAVFAPVPDLGAVVVDEEHEGSYKQSDTPRYHARAVAAVRCRHAGALCVLGTATPSLESWEMARRGKYTLLELPERVTPHPLPEVRLLDLRQEGRGPQPAADGGSRESGETGSSGPDAPGPPLFSEPLRAALQECVERGEQAILLLNRRGFSTFVQCSGCGKVWRCPRCSVSLTHHRKPERMTCHHCGFSADVPDRCDECGEPDPYHAGVGTEQVERRLAEEFPELRSVRMDVDTTGTKWAHERILERVRRGDVDVLLGTQMIAKGLDLPNVTLVGVVNADVGLNLPDFRATERTFQLLAQVAGRAGRGDRPGRVLVQTSRPEHFALQAAVSHDYETFAEQELEDRMLPGYPPHRRLANLVLSGTDADEVTGEAVDLAEWTRGLLDSQGLDGMEVVGPAPCPIEKLRGRWRWHFLVKADDAGRLGAVLRYMADRREQPSGSLRLEIDRDPQALL